MKAVLQYAGEVRSYLQDHPVESEFTFLQQPIALQQTAIVLPNGAPILPKP